MSREGIKWGEGLAKEGNWKALVSEVGQKSQQSNSFGFWQFSQSGWLIFNSYEWISSVCIYQLFPFPV